MVEGGSIRKGGGRQGEVYGRVVEGGGKEMEGGGCETSDGRRPKAEERERFRPQYIRFA